MCDVQKTFDVFFKHISWSFKMKPSCFQHTKVVVKVVGSIFPTAGPSSRVNFPFWKEEKSLLGRCNPAFWVACAKPPQC